MKKTLSASKNVPVLLNNLLDGKDLSITIEREWFENQVSQYADRIVAPI